jgi:hypothetical protein
MMVVGARSVWVAVGFAVFGAGCVATPPPPPPPECVVTTDCTADETKPMCDVEAGKCIAKPEGYLIGWGNGSPDSVQLEEVYTAPEGMETLGLGFRPNTRELWVTLRHPKHESLCTQGGNMQACESLAGSVAVIGNVLLKQPRIDVLTDGNAWHFMRRPTSLAFGENDFFVTCPESLKCNFEDDFVDFCGPTLWSADEQIFARDPGPGLNGSHMDMLHQSSYCMGVAHERANAYWVFNGHNQAIDRYDFVGDHGPGEEDHSDGVIHRWISGEVERIENVPSQMHYDKETDYLYIADTGGGRVLKLDTTSGRPGSPIMPNVDEVATQYHQEDADFEVLFRDRTIIRNPSGLVIHDYVIYVTDFDTGMIVALNDKGEVLRKLSTGLPRRSAGSLAVGPDDKLYLANPTDGVVYRINHDPHGFE